MSEEIELKVGDVLFSKSYHHGIEKVKIERFTPTQIVLEGYDTKIRKPFKNGIHQIGNGYRGPTYYLPTLELEEQYQRKLNDRIIYSYPWGKLNNEQTQSIVNLLKSFES